jgi:hypothetical protein
MAKVTVHNNGYSIDSLYKWDTGQVLEIFGLALPVVPQVHFAHEGDQLAIVRQASMDASGVIRASIPDTLLQSSARLCAYICTEQGDTFQTLYKIIIPVLGRAKPNDYAPDEEVYVYSLRDVDVEAVTLEAGSAAKVEKVQNGDKMVLRFSIPAGPQGKPGADGTVAFEELTEAQRESLRGERGPRGETGVYIGSDEPDDANVWIDPNGSPDELERWTFELTDGTLVEKDVFAR